MEITCVNCKQTWQPSAAQVLAARIKFGLGSVEHVLPCPNCHAKNMITATEFEKSDHPTPLISVLNDRAQLDIQAEHHPPRAENDGASAPTNPVPGPDPRGRQIGAVVLERGLPLLREPNPMAETMDRLSKGERIGILNTWTDGKDTWVQLGPERWATIERDGEVVIELLHD
jgi:hypothetical protein